MLGVLLVALAVGMRGDAGPPTQAQRVERITQQVRCPTCRGQSVADSDSPAAVSIRDEVRRQVALGESDSRIKRFLVDRFTDDILLSPEAKGAGLLVWALPVLGVVVVVGGLGVMFTRRRRSRTRDRQTVSDADRDLVEQAMKS